MRSSPLRCIAVLALVLWAPLPASAAPDPVMGAMDKELRRSFDGLRSAEKTPLYYLGYSVVENESYDASAVLGAVEDDQPRRWRTLDVDVRVGSRSLDNTHELKGQEAWMNDAGGMASGLSLDDDEAALRAGLWRLTDEAFKEAQKRYTKVQRNREVTAEEEDVSDDFSPTPAAHHVEGTAPLPVDAQAWRSRLKKLSVRFKPQPFIFASYAHLATMRKTRWMADSDGTRLRTGNSYVRLGYFLATRTEDGMDLSRRRSYDAERLEDLPTDEKILADIDRSVGELKALREAPLVEPYSGPSILKNRACAVYFHEILGHRLEGQRQKSENEGKTFAKKLGEPVVADFISVTDDPTQESFRGQFLRGYYRYDDEGVAARPTVLISNGILRGFLLSRSPIKGFPGSNGHGRRSSGRRAVARMGNIIVTASKSVSFPRLREMLLEEVRRQGKPYGLVFDDISGGFTGTGRSGPQSFKVIPLLVYRVYADGRPDETVRGVDIVGTPLTSFNKIIAAADDPDVFNGNCGAESGWIPVSAVAPSVLVSEMEVEKTRKSQEKPPVLPPPVHGFGEGREGEDDR